MNQIKIMIADDQVLMRDGLKTILDLEDDIDVVGMAADGQEAFELVEKLLPDVVLMDVRMPVVNGIESTKLIKSSFPEVKVIILTTFNEEGYITQALLNGADGFLTKDMNADQIIEIIRSSMKGYLLLPTFVAKELITRLSMTSAVANAEMKMGSGKIILSAREQEIAKLMVNRLNNGQISKYLNLTEGTVRNYISILYEKLGTNDRNTVISILEKQFEKSS